MLELRTKKFEMSTAGTLEKYRVTVCFFLDHNSNKNTRILVPCQESWTINRLKEEAIRRLKKNLTPSYHETDGDGTKHQDEIIVKHIENLSKDILDGDDLIRDVLDNKEILVARLEGDEDIDFFNNDYLIRGSRTGSVAGDSIHSNMLPSVHAYSESIHLPLRAETEIGTPERHPPFYHHSYYSHDRRQTSTQYPLHDDFMGEIHPPPPRSFASGYAYAPATDYEMPRIQPRYSYCRPDSCNSDIPHTSDSSNFMNAAQSRSPSVLSEENRVGQSAMPAPYHSHDLSNPENYPSDNTSPLIGITSGDSGYSNHSIPLHLYTRNISGHTEATPSLSLPLADCPRPSPRNYSPSSEPATNISPDNRNNDEVESPTLSPPPVPFGRKYRPSVMHGYINPEPEPMQEMNPIKEVPIIIEEEPMPHEPVTKTNSNDSKPSTPKVTLRLRSRVRPPNKEDLSTQRTNSPSFITLTTSGNDVTAPVDIPADCSMSTTTGVLESYAPVEESAKRIVTPPLQVQSEQHIDKVIETAIELPEQRSMDVIVKVTKEARNHSYVEDSPALPQKRAKTSSSPPPTTVTPLNPAIPVEVTPLPPAPKPETPVLNHLTTQPEEQSPDVSKSISMVGGNRSIGAKFIVELEKGSGGLGFGIKSRDTAADGMTYPHFVSSIKPGGVAEADGRLKKGDLLLEVNGTDVTSMRHVLCLDYMRKQRGRIKLKISRQDKSRQTGDPDGGAYVEARIDDDKREEEATMDLVTPLVIEVLKEPLQEETKIEIEINRDEVDRLEPSIQSIATSNTSLDELSPHQSRESIDEISSKHEKRRSSSIQNLLKQAALTDTTIFTPRGKKVQPLLIPLTEAGLGVSVRGKTRMNTNNSSQEGGIFVKLIVPGGAADKDGRLKPNDQILSINGCVLVGQTNQEAMKTLKQGLDKIEQPEIKLVVLKKLPMSSRSGKRGQRVQDNVYSRKLSLGNKNSTGYANSQLQTLPSIYHPICMEDLQKNGEGKVFSVLDTHPDLDASRDKSSASPPADYESLTQGHIYEQLDLSKKRGKRSPSDASKFRTSVQITTDDDEHIYARPQRRHTEEGIYTKANRVIYGRITAGNRSQSVETSLVRTPTYTEEIYAQPSMSKEEKSKRNRESIYESLLMVKPKYGEGVFKRRPREHLYECVTDIFDDPMSYREDNSDTNEFSALNRPVASAVNNPYEINRSLDIGPTPSDLRTPLSTAAKSMSLQKTSSGGDTMQSMFPTGRSTPRGTRNVAPSRAVPHAPISSTKRPRSRTGRIQYPNPVDLSPYFTTVQQLTGKQERIPIPLTEPPVRSTLPDSGIYKNTIREVSQGPTPVSTPHRPVPESPNIATPFEAMSPVDLTFSSEQDDSLGPIEFKRVGQGRDDVSERHPFAKDAKQLNAYKDIQIKQAEEKLKSMQQPSPAQTDTHPMCLDLDSGTNFHMQLGGSISTPTTDKQREKLAASKKGSFFGRFKKKKTTKEKNLRDTPSPLLDSYPPSADDIGTYTDMMPPDDN